MNRGLRPVDAVMFASYGVLPVLAAVGVVRSAVWRPALGLSVVCAALWVVARLELGRSFSVGAHELVTRGLYAEVRNPIYVSGPAFLLVLVAGQGWQALVV